MKQYLYSANILLPRADVELSRYSVIACDQFTSEPDYWNEVESIVGDAPSALRLTLPEIYLENDKASRVAAINARMREYAGAQLCEYPDAMVLVRRIDSVGKERLGIVAAIDLEEYSYEKKTDAAIRATEGTVLERIPPRVEIRRDALLELPHVMLLIDDPCRTVIEPIAEKASTELYNFELMLGGGKITGYLLKRDEQEKVQAAMASLAKTAPFPFAVGDGNHSLASAKAHYEAIKAELGAAAENHPARYALVEVVNLHDDSLQFEPIYRVVFGADKDDFFAAMRKDTENGTPENPAAGFTCVFKDGDEDFVYPHGTHTLAVGTLQKFIDSYLPSHPEVKIDYIHGEDSLRRIVAENEGAFGFLFDGMKKDELFVAVASDGALPRKTFSMGHAKDKRYYLEARRIKA